MNRILSTILTPIAFFLVWACSDPAEKTSEIAPVSNISYEAGNGTILFQWDKPANPDLAYTEISYVNDDNVERKVLVDANLTEQLVRGFGSNKSYEFKFITYSKQGQSSEPVTFFANPLEPLMNIFNGKVKVTVDFGGVHLTWDNIYDEDFYIDVEYTDINGNSYKEEIIAPAKATGNKFIAIGSIIEGTQTIDVATYICDLYGNQSVPNIVKFYKLEAGKLDRKNWTVIEASTEDPEGPKENILDGLASTFWHSNWSGGGSSFEAGHFLVVDLGTKKRIEKVELQHRQQKIMARGIELYGSNNYTKESDTKWTYFGSIEMDQDNKAMQIFELANAVEYRYIKLQFTTPGKGDGTYAGLAEFGIYGQDIAE